MNREETQKLIDRVMQWHIQSTGASTLVSGTLVYDIIQALELAAVPVWIRTADRVPVESDGLTICVGENESGELIEQAGWSLAKKQTQKMRDEFTQKGYVYWLPLPALPEVEK
ncbi:MAG: hypothetical protein WC356_03480 [Candidatus Micrarchaeia archaeon]|jgi:hypothetical protein